MTFRQWLVHLLSWLRSFPHDHFWVGPVGGPTEECLVCGLVRPNQDAVEEDIADGSD